MIAAFRLASSTDRPTARNSASSQHPSHGPQVFGWPASHRRERRARRSRRPPRRPNRRRRRRDPRVDVAVALHFNRRLSVGAREGARRRTRDLVGRARRPTPRRRLAPLVRRTRSSARRDDRRRRTRPGRPTAVGVLVAGAVEGAHGSGRGLREFEFVVREGEEGAELGEAHAAVAVGIHGGEEGVETRARTPRGRSAGWRSRPEPSTPVPMTSAAETDATRDATRGTNAGHMARRPRRARVRRGSVAFSKRGKCPDSLPRRRGFREFSEK